MLTADSSSLSGVPQWSERRGQHWLAENVWSQRAAGSHLWCWDWHWCRRSSTEYQLLRSVLVITRWKVLWGNTTPRKAIFGGFCHQHLATHATPTIRSIKCKQSLVYGVFRPLLPHPSTDRNETLTWSSLSPRNLPVNFGTNLSTIFLVIMVTDRHTNQRR